MGQCDNRWRPKRECVRVVCARVSLVRSLAKLIQVADAELRSLEYGRFDAVCGG